MLERVHGLFNHPGARRFLLRLRVVLFLATGVAALWFADRAWLWPGFAVSMFGQLVQLWCFATLDKNASLATNGLYAFVRNPMYLGRFFLILGMLMLLGSILVIVAYTLLYWFYMVNRVKREERHLRVVLGPPYEEYCARVRRFVPGPPYPGSHVAKWEARLLRQNHGWWNFAATAAFWAIAIAWLLGRPG
ncbi:MAG: isoprenylcysteine carboxylmethyltransferase family protein [Acidobacteria bacterium]|nr:isoprenylcysteine carboxylmethyltransferase family protein [Acidobacteriota bacterium]